MYKYNEYEWGIFNEYEWEDFNEDELNAYDFYEMEHGPDGDGDITVDENWEETDKGEGFYL